MNELCLSLVLILNLVLTVLYYDKSCYDTKTCLIKSSIELGIAIMLFIVSIIFLITTNTFKEYLFIGDTPTIFITFLYSNLRIPCITGGYISDNNPKWKKVLTTYCIVLMYVLGALVVLI